MESLPLKVLVFGLQMPTGPSSGVVACILLVSSRLDCPGMSLAEVCASKILMERTSSWNVMVRRSFKYHWLIELIKYYLC